MAAILPLIVLTGVIAFADFKASRARVENEALLARAAAVARHEALLDVTTDVLNSAGMALAPQLGSPSPDCSALSDAMLLASATRLSVIGLARADGTIVCLRTARELDAKSLGLTSLADTSWFRNSLVKPGSHFGVLDRNDAPSEPWATRSVPVSAEGRPDGVLFGLASIGALAQADSPGHADTVLWLVPTSVSGPMTTIPTGPASPLSSTLDRITHSPGVATAPSAEGTLLAYASADTSDGLRVIVAFAVGDRLETARALLVFRIGEIVVILLIGLAATIIGADAAIVRPLSRLSQAVRRWRAGEQFDPAGHGEDPTEVTELSDAFRAATNELSAALRMRDLAMQEIHHRVKNNLQVVASLLNLQANRLRQPETRAEFQSARDRVRALATLHRHLYSRGDLQRINMRHFLVELCGQIFSAMGEVEGARIGLTIEAPELAMTSDRAVPIALIVTEAVTNALKYAFPGGRRGHVAIRLTAAANATVLRIDDDGIGLPEGASETESGPRDGLGMLLIRGFARQIGATLGVEVDGGTHYVLTIPAGVPERLDGIGVAEP